MKRLLLAVSIAVLCYGITPAASAADTPAPSKPAPQLSLLPSPPVTPVAAPAVVTPSRAAAKLGLVDISRISMESTIGKAAQTKIKEQQTRLQKQVDAKKRQLEKMKADIERQLPTLSPPQREAKAKEFQKKVEELQKFGMNAEKGLLETQEKLTKELLAAIEQAAVSVGKSKGLTAVMVKRELLYLDSGVEAVDISEDIVKLVNGTGSTN